MEGNVYRTEIAGLVETVAKQATDGAWASELDRGEFASDEEFAAACEGYGCQDWLDEFPLGTTHRIGSDGQYLGSEVLITAGEPTIRINTENGQVEGQWMGHAWSAGYECPELDGILAESARGLKVSLDGPPAVRDGQRDATLDEKATDARAAAEGPGLARQAGPQGIGRCGR